MFLKDSFHSVSFQCTRAIPLLFLRVPCHFLWKVAIPCVPALRLDAAAVDQRAICLNSDTRVYCYDSLNVGNQSASQLWFHRLCGEFTPLALAFASCLCGPLRSATEERLGPSPIFLGYLHSPAHGNHSKSPGKSELLSTSCDIPFHGGVSFHFICWGMDLGGEVQVLAGASWSQCPRSSIVNKDCS